MITAIVSLVIGFGVGFYVGALWILNDQAHIPKQPPPGRDPQ